MVIDLVVGARPNFVKAAAIINAAKHYLDVTVNLIHTGQHEDVMSDPFFKELELPKPKHYLTNCGHSSNVARMSWMTVFCAESFEADKPDHVMVVGDTDSTLSGALAAAKMKIPLIHVEAGLRSRRWEMQEERNRVAVDAISDILYTTSISSRDNLIAEGHSPEDVKFVGNVMIDTMYRFLLSKRGPNEEGPNTTLGYRYAVLTLHRAENMDPQVLFSILHAIENIGDKIPIIFPVHPRTQRLLAHWYPQRVTVLPPVGYLQFLSLLDRASFVLTDSGGVQDETTALGVPCLTLRDETERPETVEYGSNLVVGLDPMNIVRAASEFYPVPETFKYRMFGRPELWDGHAADRILADLTGGPVH